MSAWIAEVNGRGVADVAAALGLTVRGAGLHTSVSPCPACQAPHRSASEPRGRGPIGLTADGHGWRCHRCQAGGDAVTLAAFVAIGAVPGRGDARWREVAASCEAHGLCAPVETIQGPATPRSRPVPVRPLPAPLPAPQRPPEADVRALWDRCLPVTEDADVCAWLTGRHLDPACVAERDLVRALPLKGPLPAWCQFRGASWRVSTHRLIVPLSGAGGRLESLHARALAPAAPRDKAASPLGAEVRGLVFADALGRWLLAGAALPPVGKVIVAEGVPDYVTWSTRFGDAADDAPAVLGVIAGSWTTAIAATIPDGWTVIIRTHQDDTGDRYAETIRASLAGRCLCKRSRTRVSTYANTGVAHRAETP